MTTTRTPFIAGNWKLHKTLQEAKQLTKELIQGLSKVRDVEVGIAPVFTALSSIASEVRDAGIRLAAQNCHWEESGAWTGEVSPSLLKDAGCSHVILGHSERRQHFHDTDEHISKRLRAALGASLEVILCVGETEQERDSDKTFAVVETQLAGCLASCPAAALQKITIAYEPVWAIGTGRTATPGQAQEVHAHIRAWLRERFGAIAEAIRIQYGGSVKPTNAGELLSQPDIDGALVGGASLDAQSFLAIVAAASL